MPERLRWRRDDLHRPEQGLAARQLPPPVEQALRVVGRIDAHDQAIDAAAEGRDRDTKLSAEFDMIERSAGIEPLAVPPGSPNLNAFAERLALSIKSECLDRMIFFGEASLHHAVTEYVEHHYLHERPHQGKDNLLLFPQHASDPLPRDGPVHCRERLGGLLKFYYTEAA